MAKKIEKKYTRQLKLKRTALAAEVAAPSSDKTNGSSVINSRAAGANLLGGGKGRVRFFDRSGRLVDLSRKTASIGGSSAPLGTIFKNPSLVGESAYIRCSYTSFALYDKKRGFYYTRLLVRITDEAALKQMYTLMEKTMGSSWTKYYAESKTDHFNERIFPWGWMAEISPELGYMYNLRNGKITNNFYSANSNTLFGLGDKYLYKIIDLTQWRKLQSDAKEQLSDLAANDMLEQGYVVRDKNENIHTYIGMLTGNYMWLPKGTLYGFGVGRHSQQLRKLRKNALFYELDTALLLDYESTPVNISYSEMLRGAPTSFKNKNGSGTDGQYQCMVAALKRDLAAKPINTDISGNIKFWVRRSELFLEGQDEREISAETQFNIAPTNSSNGGSNWLKLLALGYLSTKL